MLWPWAIRCSPPVRWFARSIDAGGQAGKGEGDSIDCNLQGPSLSDDGTAVEVLMRMDGDAMFAALLTSRRARAVLTAGGRKGGREEQEVVSRCF